MKGWSAAKWANLRRRFAKCRLDAPLTTKQTRFVEEYLVDLSATQAEIRAGYSVRTAASIGNEIMRKPEIKAAITEAQKARSLRTGITADRVLQELADVAFGKISKVISWVGTGLSSGRVRRYPTRMPR